MITALFLLLAPAASAHGGEDHSAPPPPAAAQGTRAATWSTEFEAVLDLGEARPGEPVQGTLLVADFNTSAPLQAGSAQLELKGPAEVRAQATAGEHAGFWPFTLTFPAAGSYSGGLTVFTADRADVLGVPAIEIGAPAHEHPPAAFPWLPVALAGLALFAVGVLLGRRTAAVAALLLSARLVQAHGGEDHSVAAPAAPASAGLRLPLESQFLLELRTARVVKRPLQEQIDALGTVVARPGGHAALHAPVSGTFELSRELLPGAVVRAGEVLGTLNEALTSADRAGLAQSRAAAELELAEAKAALALAERDAARAAGLGEVLSERERQSRAQGLAVAQERARQAERALEAMPGARVPIRAPMNGRITGISARPGDTVQAGQELLHIAAPGALWVEARVPETRAGQIGGGAAVRADARPGQLLPATVLDPGLEADPVSGMLKLLLVVNEPPAWLVPGMSVTADLQVGAPREALTVPDAAIVDSAGETIVFVKTAPESFALRRVRVGSRSGEDREVLAGLEPGERVVVTGTYNLRSLAGR